MSKWWKKIKRFLLLREEDLDRRVMVRVRLVLCVLLLAGIWMRLGCPLPTAELEFRRMERTHLLPPGEIVLAADRRSVDKRAVSGDDWSVYALDGTELHLRGRWFVSLGEDWAAIAQVGRHDWDRDFRSVPLEQEGPTLLPLSFGGYNGGGYWVTETSSRGVTAYEYHNFFSVLLLNVPEETARTEIAIRSEAGVSTGPGMELDSGAWLLMPDNQTLEVGWYEKSGYTLTLFREDGSLLLEHSGTFGE